jgi:hypothetical protein
MLKNFLLWLLSQPSFVPTSDKQYEIKGNMTMHGITKEISFTATLEGFGKNMQGARVASFDLTVQSSEVSLVLLGTLRLKLAALR